MRISLQPFIQSEKTVLTWEKNLSCDELCLEIPQLKKLETVQTSGQVKKVNEHLYQVTGKLLTKATFICSRCLKEFALPLSTQWDLSFTRSPTTAMEAAEKDVRLLEGDALSLSPMVREALLLEIPYAPICREDCKGLCQVCGADRNETVCECQDETIDPRWSKLQQFLKEG